MYPRAVLMLLAGCSQGYWSLTAHPSDQSVTVTDFADGCSATFHQVLVGVTGAELLDGLSDPITAFDDPLVHDLVFGGPQAWGEGTAPADLYPKYRLTTAPDPAFGAGLASDEQAEFLSSRGYATYFDATLTCPSGTVDFDWGFDQETTYTCKTEVAVESSGYAESEISVHPEVLFRAGFEDDEDAVLRGEELVAADLDGDGRVRAEEILEVSISDLDNYDPGYTHSELETLGNWVAYQVRTLVRTSDGEACERDL